MYMTQYNIYITYINIYLSLQMTKIDLELNIGNKFDEGIS